MWYFGSRKLMKDRYENYNLWSDEKCKLIDSIISQDKYHPNIKFDPKWAHQATTDHYTDYVNKNFINTIKGSIMNIENNIVHFSDNSMIEADVIILCTGYNVDLSFLDDTIPESLQPIDSRGNVSLNSFTITNKNVKNRHS
jgi:hypothetical protein